MKKIEFIHSDIYKANIWYFRGWDYKEFKNYLEKKYGYERNGKSEPSGSMIILPLKNDKTGEEVTIYCLWLDDIKDFPTIAHEAFHIINYILRARGLKLSDDSDESYAYFLEWLIRQILKYEDKNKKKKFKK